jgi:thiol:disulfide interchange protein DsbD
LKRLPKPGAWMEIFKQVLAFPLYATALWLAWVLGNQTGANGFGAILFGCLLLAFAAIIGSRGNVGKIIAAIAIASALLLPFSSLITESSAAENSSAPLGQHADDGLPHPWTAARLSQLRSEGKAVFVNVTADWCISCLANEKLVLSNAQIREQFKARNITYLKADWTRYDADITNYLAEFGRNGVPLYVFYPANNGTAVVLPQLLREKDISNLPTNSNIER